MLALDAPFFVLAGGGFIIGVVAVVVGGGMFFSVPLLQWLFPQATMGVIVGNLKLGGFFRGLGSTVATHPKISYRECFRLAPVAFVGAVLGAAVISELDQRWLLPAILVAIALTLLAPRIAERVRPRLFHATAFLTGFYAGIFGAGIGVMLLALLRLKFPKDADIGFVKIQARFIELLLILTAVFTHSVQGNMVAAIWVPWSLGGLLGGYVGGLLLGKTGDLPGGIQKRILYVVFAIDILVAATKFSP